MAAKHLVVTILAFASQGSSLPMTSVLTSAPMVGNDFRFDESRTGLLLEDAWVDTQVTLQQPSLCTSLSECGWNGTAFAYADILGSKSSTFSDDVSIASGARDSPSTTILEERRALERHAVRLSLMLEDGCLKHGQRTCLRFGVPQNGDINRKAASRELRPITISFEREPSASRALLVEAPLITSLRDFHLSSF